MGADRVRVFTMRMAPHTERRKLEEHDVRSKLGGLRLEALLLLGFAARRERADRELDVLEREVVGAETGLDEREVSSDVVCLLQRPRLLELRARGFELTCEGELLPLGVQAIRLRSRIGGRGGLGVRSGERSQRDRQGRDRKCESAKEDHAGLRSSHRLARRRGVCLDGAGVVVIPA